MIRSAAKNHERVAVVVDPADYARVLGELQATGEVSAPTRYALARKAFAHTAAYDGAIASYLGRLATPEAPLADFPDTLHLSASLARALRYGENPHQKAAFYALDGDAGPVAREGRGAAGQGAQLQQPPRSRRRHAPVRRVRAAGRRDHQAQQPVRRRRRATRASPRPTGARARPIPSRRSAASSPSTGRSTPRSRAR